MIWRAREEMEALRQQALDHIPDGRKPGGHQRRPVYGFQFLWHFTALLSFMLSL